METEIIVFNFKRERESIRELSRTNIHHTHICRQNFREDDHFHLTPKKLQINQTKQY